MSSKKNIYYSTLAKERKRTPPTFGTKTVRPEPESTPSPTHLIMKSTSIFTAISACVAAAVIARCCAMQEVLSEQRGAQEAERLSETRAEAAAVEGPDSPATGPGHQDYQRRQTIFGEPDTLVPEPDALPPTSNEENAPAVDVHNVDEEEGRSSFCSICSSCCPPWGSGADAPGHQTSNNLRGDSLTQSLLTPPGQTLPHGVKVYDFAKPGVSNPIATNRLDMFQPERASFSSSHSPPSDAADVIARQVEKQE